ERIPMGGRQLIPDGRRDTLLAAKHFFQRSEQQRERRPELVADVGEERRLRAIQRRERFGTASLLLVRARVRDRGRDLRGQQLEERSVPLVEREARAQPRDEESGQVVRLVG